MFPDGKIVKDTRFGADKVKYVIKFRTAPVFKNALTESLKKSEFCVVSFDESLNDNTLNCEMGVLSRYFDAEKLVILIHTFLVIQHKDLLV